MAMVVDRRTTTTVLSLLLILCLFSSTTFEQRIERLSSISERIALLELRSSLGLRSKDWPKKSDPCLIWKGVECGNGSVIGINISGLRRTRVGKRNPRFSVDALVNFTRLVSFNASRFLLNGSIPYWFGESLVSLQVLDLRLCSIRGGIPWSMGNMSNLNTLILADNALTGRVPPSLGQIFGLSVLDISKNSLTGVVPKSVGSLRNLSVLDMSNNFLMGSIPISIGTLSELRYLNLSVNSLSSSIPAQLWELRSLSDLDIGSNSFTGFLPLNLRGLRNLQKMLIGDNFLSGSLPVDLFNTLSQLQIVDLRRNNFTGVIPSVLWTMPSLQVLDISGNSFTGFLPDYALNAYATSAQLNLSGNMLYGVLTPILRRFSSIDLFGNYFEGNVSDYIRRNTSFESNCLQNVSRQRTSGECASFYSSRGLTFDNFGFPNSTQTPIERSSGHSHRNIIILASTIGGFVLIVLFALLLFCICCICKKKRFSSQRGVGVRPTPAVASPTPTKESMNLSSLGDVFTYQKLLQATCDFNAENFIKHGHSGDFFLGVLENGFPVVIKRIDLQLIKKEDYLMELDVFSKVSHTRFVPLFGHYFENESEKFLVYNYMPNGDLSSSLYRKSSADDDSLHSLDWITRLKIALGTAEGLAYLHHECTPPLVHRDVQASSILLDDKFEVRLGSLSKVCIQEGETQQSKITRFLRVPQSTEQGASGSGSTTATCSYDVYCFGKVLLELVTGKLGISASNDTQAKESLEHTLPYISTYDKELVTKIVDPHLIIDEDLLEEVWAMAIVAKSCLNPKPSRRPPMKYILKALENPLKVVREPPSSARLKKTSSRGSWNAALFGSWQHGSLDLSVAPAMLGSRQGSLNNNGGGEISLSRRRQSKDIFPVQLSDMENV